MIQDPMLQGSHDAGPHDAGPDDAGPHDAAIIAGRHVAGPHVTDMSSNYYGDQTAISEEPNRWRGEQRVK